MHRSRTLTILTAVLLFFVLLAGSFPVTAVQGATGDPVLINEILASHTGADDTEYVEFYGTPGASLDGLSLIAVESSSASTLGTIDERIDFGPGDMLGDNGFFLVGNAAGLSANYGVTPNIDYDPNFENDDTTYALVETSSLSGSSVSGSEVVLDSVAFQDADGGTFYFGAPVVGPDGSYYPAGGYRAVDGVDTDTAADWVIADFGLGSENTPTAGTGGPTPTPPPLTSIWDIQYTEDPGGDSPYEGQTVTTTGVVTAFFGAGGDRRFFIQDGTGEWSGLFLFEPDAYLDVGDLVQVTGEVSEYYGLTQIAFGDAEVLAGDQDLPAPAVLPSGEVSQEAWESVLVRVEEVTVADGSLGYGEWSVDDGSGAVRVDDLGYYVYPPETGDFLRYVQGPLYYAYGDFKIEPRGDEDILQPAAIMEIQGSGMTSPLEGQQVETTGVVTAVVYNGFYVQDPAGDGDPATSDALFVFKFGWKPAVGDQVVLVDVVEEYVPGGAGTGNQPTTELTYPGITVLSSDNPLPDPTPLVDLPDVSIPDGLVFWESLEAMLVRVVDGRVVSPTSRFGEFALLTEADAVPGSGYYPQAKQILIRSLGPNQVDYNPERVLVDDTSLEEAIQVRPGDQVKTLVGVVDYSFGNYKLQPLDYRVKTHKLPKVPLSKRSGPPGNLTVTTFNVENLFDLVDEPGKDDIGTGGAPNQAALNRQLAKLALAVELELALPEIIVLQEIENQSIAQALGDLVNAAAGTNYTAVSFETSDGRGIEPGFLWDADRVSLVEAYQMAGPDVAAWFGPGSPSPGREPIVGVFEFRGQEITIIGNHFKSKGGDDPLFGVHWPPDRVTEVQRKGQARVVREFVNGILDADPEALVMVAGDLNDFQFGELGEGADHPLAILAGGPGEVPLTNLIEQEKAAERFTYLYDGNSQVLDHLLVSPALLEKLVGTDILHFNAAYPAELEYMGNTPIRSSDHDPVEARFKVK